MVTQIQGGGGEEAQMGQVRAHGTRPGSSSGWASHRPSSSPRVV